MKNVIKENTKVSLSTNDTLKCPACGNKTFSIYKKEKQMDGMMVDAWVAVCEDCGHVMKFRKQLAPKDSIL